MIAALVAAGIGVLAAAGALPVVSRPPLGPEPLRTACALDVGVTLVTLALATFAVLLGYRRSALAGAVLATLVGGAAVASHVGGPNIALGSFLGPLVGLPPDEPGAPLPPIVLAFGLIAGPLVVGLTMRSRTAAGVAIVTGGIMLGVGLASFAAGMAQLDVAQVGGGLSRPAAGTALAVALAGVALVCATGPQPWPGGNRLARWMPAALALTTIASVSVIWWALVRPLRDPRPIVDPASTADAIATISVLGAAVLGMTVLFGLRARDHARRAEETATELAAVAAERLQVADRLRSSEERYRTLVEQSVDAIFVAGTDGRLVELNDPACRLLGQTREALLGSVAADLFDPADETYPIPPDGAGTNPIFTTTREIRRPDGTIVIAEVVGQRRKDGLFQATARDLTERLRAETERARLVAAIDQATDAVMILGADERITYVNAAFERLTGVPREALIGRNHENAGLLATDPDACAAIRSAIESRRGWTGDITALRPDGAPVDLAISVSPVRDDLGVPLGFVGVARDVTAFRRIEDELRRAQKMEAIGRLAGGVAHDFNNLLTAIRGFVELARDGLPSSSETRADLDEALRSAGRAADLTSQMLAFAKRQQTRPEVVDANALIRSVVPLLRPLAAPTVDLEVDLAAEPRHVLVDRAQFEWMIVNLAANARDAMPDGGTIAIATTSVDLDVDAARPLGLAAGRYFRLAVSDTGRGMDAAVREHLFEPFFSTKGGGRGVGLGLAVVYGVVQQSGGHIGVASLPGSGSVFVIHLPVVEAAEPEGTSTATGGAERVLLVEDDDAVRQLLHRALEERGYRVREAMNGEEAMDIAEAHGMPDLLVTDLVMPGIGGRALARHLRRREPELPILIVSGYDRDGTRADEPDHVPAAFLAKPFTVEQFAAAVRATLDGSGRVGVPG